MEAYRSLGRQSIPSLIFDTDPLRVELAEIDENVQRTDLTALEWSQVLKRRKEIYEELHPETKAGAAGGIASVKAQGKTPIASNQTTDKKSVASFAVDTAAKLNVDQRTIRRDVQIAEKIAPAVQQKIAATPIADSKTDLLALAKLAPKQQERVIDRIMSGKSETVIPFSEAAPVSDSRL